jgi:prophage regulatory protein
MTPTVLIPIAEVARRSGFCKSQVYALVREGKFPKPTHIGASSRWSEQEVQAWIDARLAEREPDQHDGATA